MPRISREKSESGIYHIILRGTNKQEIFHDDEDNLRFLEIIDKYKRQCEIKIYGWCLMGNHVHLLLGEGKEELSVTMKRIGVSYAWFYNRKYYTTGHLFQDRYKSENIDSDTYLMTVIRYIHQNPIKARLVNKASEWKWSSCEGYYFDPPQLLDSGFILDIFSKSREKAIGLFKKFSEEVNEDFCLEDDVRKRLTDIEAREEIKKLIKTVEIAQIKGLPKEQRNEFIKRIKGVEGLTQRQAARILGVSQKLISVI